MTGKPEDTKISQLKNLGPKSAEWLAAIDIHTLADLRTIGAITAYEKIKRTGFNPSLNLLYALVGAIDNIHWTEVKKQQKHDLVLLLDARTDLEI